MASNNRGACDLTDTVGSPTSVADIWSGLTSVGIDCGSGAESYGGGEGLLARDRRLWQIFGWGSCRFGIFGSGSTSVGDVNAPDRIPGEDMPCGYIWSR